MSIKKSMKKFARAVNKKLVETSPISSIPPFNDVKNQPVKGFDAAEEICEVCSTPISDGDAYIGMHDGEKWLHCHGRCEDALEKQIKENSPVSQGAKRGEPY